jgi:hypothetical protein
VMNETVLFLYQNTSRNVKHPALCIKTPQWSSKHHVQVPQQLSEVSNIQLQFSFVAFWLATQQ